MKDGQVEEHEKEVYGALNKYFDKILTDSGYLGTVLELGKKVGKDENEFNRWLFEQNDMSGAFMFVSNKLEVYATPYWEYEGGVAYAVYVDGEPFMHNLEHVAGTIPIAVTGNSQTDVEAYVGLVDDLMERYNL